MIKGKSKVAIIGTGLVGSSIAFAMSINSMSTELVLIDFNKGKAIGEAMDINHGIAFLGQMSVYAGDYSDCENCDVIIIAAGVSSKPGESRTELTRKNLAIAHDIITNIMKYYNYGTILVVSNPVDILTYMIQKWSGLPVGKVFGTGTVLDSARFRYLIGKKLEVDVRNVHGYIIGEHGDSQLPAWSSTHVAGKNINEYCQHPGSGFTDEDKIAIAEEVRIAGSTIIKNKGATHYAIAIVVNTIVETLLKDQHTIRTVSSLINGHYGINDVALSLPSVVTSDGVKSILDIKLEKSEEEALRYSALQIKIILDEIKGIEF